MRVGSMQGLPSPLHTGNQAVILLAYPCFLQGLVQERRLPVHTELAQNHLTLLYHIRIHGRHLIHLLAEDVQFLVRSNHLYLVLREKADRRSGNINPFLAPKDGDHMDAVFLSEIQLRQCPAHPCRLAGDFKIRQVQVARQQTPRILRFLLSHILGTHVAVPQILEECPLYHDGLLLQLAGEYHQGHQQHRHSKHQTDGHLEQTGYNEHDKRNTQQQTQYNGSHQRRPVSTVIFP